MLSPLADFSLACRVARQLSILYRVDVRVLQAGLIPSA